MGLSIGTTEFVQRRVDADGPTQIVRVLLVINLILFVGLVTFANAPYLSIVLMAYWTIGVMRSLYVPLWVAWINQNVESGVRATMNSAAGQIDAFGQIAGGPGVGMVGNATSTRIAITVSSMMLVPVLALYTRTIRRQSRSVEVASTSQA
jgi:DHA3 family tetracycline resistance protein-like MFS transporter